MLTFLWSLSSEYPGQYLCIVRMNYGTGLHCMVVLAVVVRTVSGPMHCVSVSL